MGGKTFRKIAYYYINESLKTLTITLNCVLYQVEHLRKSQTKKGKYIIYVLPFISVFEKNGRQIFDKMYGFHSCYACAVLQLNESLAAW